MNNSWDYISTGIHTLYEIAGILLLVGISLSVKQLKISKQESSYRARRDHYEQTVKSLEDYSTRILRSQEVYYEQAAKQNQNGYSLINTKNFEKYFEENKFNVNLMELTPEELEESFWRIDSGVLTVLHQIEFYSMMMTQGLSDEKIAFHITSDDFCNFVKSNYLSICILKRKLPFENTINLFEMWHARMEYKNIKMYISPDYELIKSR